MSADVLRQLEQDTKIQQKFVELGATLERLKTNKDFKKLVLEGYFEQEAIRLVHLKSNPAFQTEDKQKSVDLQIMAVGSLGQYFNTVRQQADMAVKQLMSIEQVREEILEEGAV